MLKTLIVEDNALFRLLFGKCLQNLRPDMLIDEALDGCHVVELVGILKPDIVFMDINLPCANGLCLTRKIKSIHPQITIVIVTSHDQPEYKEAAKAAGADHFLQKDALDRVEIKAILSALHDQTSNPAQPLLPKSTSKAINLSRSW